MADRDIEKDCKTDYFVDTLRRLADCLEKQEPFRIQVANKRFTVPGKAALQIEHEIEGRDEELELQLRWVNAD